MINYNMGSYLYHRRFVNIQLKILVIEYVYVYLELKQYVVLDMYKAQPVINGIQIAKEKYQIVYIFKMGLKLYVL
jgi:hypothetical protein